MGGTAGDGSYEWLRRRLPDIPSAPSETEREVVWVDPSRVLGVARDHRGRVEVFVVGAPLIARSKIVRDSLEHQPWTTVAGEALPASRVVLPLAEHYDGVAALFCKELLDNSVQERAQEAFERVEPLLAMALTRTQMTDEVLLGLLGELALLEALARAAPKATVADIMRSWAGSSPSARDFQLGTVGVEVKTTSLPSSIHHVQGVHQVEQGHSNSGGAESHLFLLSLGVRWVLEDHGGTSIPGLVESILERVDEAQARDDFLNRVKQYGGDSAVGYDHERDRERPRYLQRFSFRFERLYDMTDPRIRVLHSADLIELSEIDPVSVSFRIQLRDKVRGDLNPVSGWQAITRAVLEASSLA